MKDEEWIDIIKKISESIDIEKIDNDPDSKFIMTQIVEYSGSADGDLDLEIFIASEMGRQFSDENAVGEFEKFLELLQENLEKHEWIGIFDRFDGFMHLYHKYKPE
ncbi:MAG: hypothetical protein ACXAEU_08840 [Candidatus Hodarchaeales archaeon]|jgi:hypothetical protein